MQNDQITEDLDQIAGMAANWDGEGADPPSRASVEACRKFVALLPDNFEEPETMLHASGRTSLYWNNRVMYADVEFMDDGRVVYYVEDDGVEAKGTLPFDGLTLPKIPLLLWEPPE